MPATIDWIRIADPEKRKWVLRIIDEESQRVSEDFHMSLTEDAANDQWDLKITRSDSVVSASFEGASGDHEPTRFRIKLMEVLKIGPFGF